LVKTRPGAAAKEEEAESSEMEAAVKS